MAKEPIELEAYFIPQKTKTNYPTGNPEVNPRKMAKGIAFSVTKPTEIRFFTLLAQNNPSFIRKVDKKGAEQTLGSKAKDIDEDDYMVRSKLATDEIAKLKEELKNANSTIKSQTTKVMTLQDDKISLEEAVKNEELNNEVTKLKAQLKSQQKTIKKLNKQQQR